MRSILALALLGEALAFGLPQPLTKKTGLCQQRNGLKPVPASLLAPARSRQSTTARAVATSGGEDSSMMETLKTGSFFALWYNIYNKKALNAMPLPWTLATVQLFAGIPYVALLWATGLRKAPKLSTDNVKTLFPASEPVVSAALSAVMLKAYYSPITYLTLLPIVGGVGLASLKELSFTWLGFAAAMLSNVSSALRGILAKKTMGGGVGENMNETNLYAVLTIIAFAVLLPVSLCVETPAAVGSAIDAAVAAGHTKKDLAVLSALSGAYYYLYNEVAFLALGRVNPVTHAVGNTIKRVVIIIASVIAFNTPISTLGVVGSSIAITGTLLYSLAKQRFARAADAGHPAPSAAARAPRAPTHPPPLARQILP
ncbi:hypothetical protein JL721_11315 [Aureococcus anophagefferens]|nr:hypothetical protein JL721_11315 [Aureococcus anophagefferens]